MHFGNPSAEECDAYTRVLLGNLDINRLHYPANLNIHGGDIDILARRRLWEAGLNYGHGTGHGVGYFLNVHEGPCGISKIKNEPLIPGMVISNGNYIHEIQSLVIIRMVSLVLESKISLLLWKKMKAFGDLKT